MILGPGNALIDDLMCKYFYNKNFDKDGLCKKGKLINKIF